MKSNIPPIIDISSLPGQSATELLARRFLEYMRSEPPLLLLSPDFLSDVIGTESDLLSERMLGAPDSGTWRTIFRCAYMAVCKPEKGIRFGARSLELHGLLGEASQKYDGIYVPHDAAILLMESICMDCGDKAFLSYRTAKRVFEERERYFSITAYGRKKLRLGGEFRISERPLCFDSPHEFFSLIQGLSPPDY